jgi:hypothetical protein
MMSITSDDNEKESQNKCDDSNTYKNGVKSHY